jgi:hypothetical protein
MAVNSVRESPYGDELRLLWRVALAVFVITVAIGLVNGQRVTSINPTAERFILLTHLHTGTLGWITLSLFAAVLWIFTAGQEVSAASGTPRLLARYAALAVGIYPLAFFLFYPGGLASNGAILGVFGSLALLAILGMLVWTLGQMSRVYLSVARLAAVTALINLAIGGILGVLIEAGFAGFGVSGNVNTAHPAMMTIGYVLPAAFVFIEWRLGAGIDGRRSVPGTIAVILLLVGGWLAVIASLLNLVALFPAILLFQIVAAIIMAVRMAPRVFSVSWMDGGARHVAITAIAVVLDVGLLFYLVSAFFAQQLEPPRELFVATAHTEFVGMMTNALFATLLLATALRRASTWPWADAVIFWGVNIGWVGFVVAELAGVPNLVRLFTPIMGLSLLLGIATFWMRLGGPIEDPVTAP